MDRTNKTAIFIDGSNLYATSKSLGFDLDYKQLLIHFSDGLIRATYYTAVDPNRRDPISGELDNKLIPLVDWLSYNGYSVVRKPTKEFTDDRGNKKIKGNMDIEIAVDCLELAAYIDHAILFSGDGDFTCLIHALHRLGVRVTVVSSINTNPPMVADELRRAADRFIDLIELKAQLTSVIDRKHRYA